MISSSLKIIVLIGYIGLGFALFGTIQQITLVTNGERAIGKVIAVHEYAIDSTTQSKAKRYQAVVEFENLKKEKVQFKPLASYSSNEFVVGNSVHVLFHHGRTLEPHIDSIADIWLPPIAIAFFGSVLLFFGRLALKIYNKATTVNTKHIFVDSAFFAHNREDKGRFRSITATLVKVLPQSESDSLMLSFEGIDFDTKEKRTWTTDWATYRKDDLVVNAASSAESIGQSVKLTYDSEDKQKFHTVALDLLSISDAKSLKVI